MQSLQIPAYRIGNNVWSKNLYYDSKKPTLLLNSHHDTVKPNSGYTLNPFEPLEKDGKSYGLGSNDAGGALVCLLGAFVHFYEKKDLPFNIIYAATAEEETSGTGGVELVSTELGKIDFAIVGEPTLLKIAVAERGLMVVDAVAKGKAGHAARNEGINAIYIALKDIEKIKNLTFDKESEWLGKISMNVTVIQAGTAHNQVPEKCSFTIDIRLNEHYTHEQVLEILQNNLQSELKIRSSRMKPSFIDLNHPLIIAAQRLNIDLYGSPTTSDQALMPWDSIKLGPGDSARSHSADEFIFIQEIEDGLNCYCSLINKLSHQFNQVKK
ncbi:MAG: M20/M25/M40 family metallo-hydrolase [Bacteroidetes bacterium]|nr:M20/M25/M40 family metallo-hydrolase [Bacteroidota bacterium]